MARSTLDERRPRCLVEAGYGIGDIIEATPACHALWRLGFDVDLFVNRPDAARIAPLFAGGPVLGRVFTTRDQIDPRDHDLAIACFGPAQAARRLPPGFWFSVSLRDVTRDGLMGANLLAARGLGHRGDPPPHLIRLDGDGLDVPPRSVVVHAGSDPAGTYKRWPHWETVCSRLEDLGLHVIVVGTDDDRSESGWERHYDPRFDLPLPRLAALLHGAHAYLGTDSGVSHLAGAVGAPGLVLFGPTDPRCYAPATPALHVLDTPPRPGEGRHPVSRRFPSMDRLEFEAVFREVTRVLAAPRRSVPPAAHARLDSPTGDPSARLPTVAEVRTAPPTLDAIDDLLRRSTSAAILGWLARRSDPALAARWRREIHRVIGRVHLYAASIRRTLQTEISQRRARSHLRQASRAGYVVRAGVARLALAATRRSTLRPEEDSLRH